MWDDIILLINIILTIVSGIGALKSITYFKKTKELTIYTQAANVIDEVNEMLTILFKSLEIATRKVKKKVRGTNYDKEISDCGKKLGEHYQIIERDLPARYYDKLREILCKDDFNFIKYINSFISGDVLMSEGLDHDDFAKCQDRLYLLQKFLKEEREKIEEKLK